MHRLSLLALLIPLSLTGCAAQSDDFAPVACEGKCDLGTLDADAALDSSVPGEGAVLRLTVDARRDGTIDATEADALGAFTRRYQGQNQRISGYLQQLLETDSALSADAAEVLSRAISGARPGDVPLDNDVYRLELGSSDFLNDDALYIKGYGAVEASTGLVSHSRGYAAKRDGVLFKRHGSPAPRYLTTTTAAESEVLRTQGPDAALDTAAVIAGLELSQFSTFAATARNSAHYDPSSDTPFWAGICQGWTHNALDDRLSYLVDAPGPQGQRGIWIFGQWISRADLGNAMMGASLSLGIADAVTIDSFVKPDSLVKALAQHVLSSGRGLRVDIWNDSHNSTGGYSSQIWNQPIVAARVATEPVTDATAEAILTYARREASSWNPLPTDAGVELVTATATWGVETDDSWEGAPAFRDSNWAMYLITDASGLVIKGYMAHDLAQAGLQGLPVTTSDGLPDYIAYPKHELTDASFEGAPHWLLAPHSDVGVRFRFLVGTVLARGIPDPTRRAFEDAAFADVTPDAASLAASFPGIANAYSPEQWANTFEPLLGSAAAFGAVWAAE